MIIEDLEAQGYRVCVHPIRWSSKWYWTAGVYIGDNSKGTWIDSNNGLPRACYNTYREALDTVVKYCEEESNKRQRRSKV